MGIRFVLLVTAWVALVLPRPVVAGPSDQAGQENIQPSVIINEIKLGGGDSPEFREYVTLYNTGETEISLDGWTLEYAKLARPELEAAFCTAPDWSDFASVTVSDTDLSGMILTPNGVSEPIVRQLNDTGSGSLRLVDASDPDQIVVHDLVGWGDGAPCKESEATNTPAKDTSLIRYLICDANKPQDTDDNKVDFAIDQTPTPGTIGTSYGPDCDEPEEPPVTNSCEGIVISEVLPNAEGSDAGKEFIELYNPTPDFVDLSGCGLQLAGDDYVYLFGSVSLSPEQYRAFSDTETDITLPNSAGGTIYLLSAADEELQSVAYPGDLDGDVAWAWFGANDWRQTYTPTPGSSNVSQPTEPCPEGQTRNDDTGRCSSTTSPHAEGLKPCDPGKERNPATNRCRSTAAVASALKPCKPDQERNPETNRCRSVASAASQLKPCKEGQERNPETNRCRKVAGAATGGKGGVKDIQAPSSASTGWWVAGLAATGAAGYGLWEWRRELAGFASRFLRKVPGTTQ